MNRLLLLLSVLVLVGAFGACSAAGRGGTVTGGAAYAAGGTPTTVDIRPPVPVTVGYELPAANSHAFLLVVAPNSSGVVFEIRDSLGVLITSSSVSVTLEFGFVTASNRVELKVDGVTYSGDYAKLGTVSDSIDPVVEPYTTRFFRRDRVSFTMYGVSTYFDVQLP